MSYIGNQPTSVAFLTDQFSGTGSQTAFTLSAAPANTASIIVAVSGVLQDPTTYSTSGLTLTFSAAPPSGTGNISVRFLGIPASNITTTAYRTLTEFTATAGQTTFTVPSYTVGYISVYRNGVMLGTADFTATSGTTVVLATGATAGDLITTESFYVSSVLNAIPATSGAVTTPYILDGSVTQAKLSTNVAGNGPAFCYTNNGIQTFSVSTYTKILFTTSVFDTTSGMYSSSRFTPTVAGYYQITASLNFDYAGSAGSLTTALIYKNGTAYQVSSIRLSGSYGPYGGQQAQSLIYCNGSTDYIEVYAFTNNTSPQINQSNTTSGTTNFSGVLVRSA